MTPAELDQHNRLTALAHSHHLAPAERAKALRALAALAAGPRLEPNGPRFKPLRPLYERTPPRSGRLRHIYAAAGLDNQTRRLDTRTWQQREARIYGPAYPLLIAARAEEANVTRTRKMQTAMQRAQAQARAAAAAGRNPQAPRA